MLGLRKLEVSEQLYINEKDVFRIFYGVFGFSIDGLPVFTE
jgi:hypothetical protein